MEDGSELRAHAEAIVRSVDRMHFDKSMTQLKRAVEGNFTNPEFAEQVERNFDKLAKYASFFLNDSIAHVTAEEAASKFGEAMRTFAFMAFYVDIANSGSKELLPHNLRGAAREFIEDRHNKITASAFIDEVLKAREEGALNLGNHFDILAHARAFCKIAEREQGCGGERIR